MLCLSLSRVYSACNSTSHKWWAIQTEGPNPQAQWHISKRQWNYKISYMCAHEKTQASRVKKRRQQKETNKHTDSQACTRHHWSLLKLSDTCLPFLFHPRCSNCSMDGNSKSSPKHTGWICAFLFSITITPDRQEHTYFTGLFFFLGDVFYTACVKSCPPCCIR